jgi:hypothetical protein
MAVTAHFYDNFWINLAAKTIDLTTDTLKGALVTSSYTPNLATDEFWSTPQADEVANGNGYTTGGMTLTSVTFSLVSGVATLNFANLSWTSATFSASFLVIYDDQTGTASTAPLIGIVEFGQVESPSDGTLSISWASGVGTITSS